MKELNNTQALERAAKLNKYDSEVSIVDGKRTLLTSTTLPIEERLRAPIETAVENFLKEVEYDGDIDDAVNFIGAQMCEALIEKLSDVANISIISANLPY